MGKIRYANREGRAVVGTVRYIKGENCLTLSLHVAQSSILKTEAVGSFEMLIYIFLKTRHYIPEDLYPHFYGRENLRPQEHSTFHTNTGQLNVRNIFY